MWKHSSLTRFLQSSQLSRWTGPAASRKIFYGELDFTEGSGFEEPAGGQTNSTARRKDQSIGTGVSDPHRGSTPREDSAVEKGSCQHRRSRRTRAPSARDFARSIRGRQKRGAPALWQNDPGLRSANRLE